jgi:hypothetical protein
MKKKKEKIAKYRNFKFMPSLRCPNEKIPGPTQLVYRDFFRGQEKLGS